MLLRWALVCCIAALVAAGGWSCRGRSETMHPSPLTVTSTAFAEGQTIPRRYTGEGEDLSPPLAFSGVPPQAAELALVCSDPDAPVGTWYHWVLYGLAPDVTSLPEGLPRQAQLQTPVAAKQGRNSWPSDNVGYRGPMPPRGHGRHRYIFTLYALDQPVTLPPEEATAERLLAAIRGHILAQGQLMGTYQR